MLAAREEDVMATDYVQAETMMAQTADGARFAYRRVGAPGERPLVLLQHFRGSLDSWDPALIDALAATRDVIVFDNSGVGGSSGTTPASIEAMARGAITFLATLGLSETDLLGFSIGSFVAQEIVLTRPSLVRRLVLASSAPRGAPGMHGWSADVIGAIGNPRTLPQDFLRIFFSPSAASQQAGKDFFGRMMARTSDRDAPVTWATQLAQYDAVTRWGIPDFGALERVTAIAVPVFIANGDSDPMILPRYSHLLAGLIPDAAIKIYPDAAHGFLFQHHAEFAADVAAFLDR